MHKKYTLSASALLIALLTACSGGGGSSSSPSTSPQKQLQPKAKPEMPQPEAKPEVPQPEAKPEMPQPEAKPEMPQPEAKPEVPQPEVKPEMPQPEAKPEVPQPEVKPEVPQPEAKPEVPQPEAKPEMPQPEAKPEIPQPEPKPEVPQPKYTGVYFINDVKDLKSVNISVDKLGSENLDAITINGNTIKLSDIDGIFWHSHQAPLDSNEVYKHNRGPVHLEHSVFGLYDTDVSSDHYDFKLQGFSIGKQTPKNALPTTGTIHYIGKAWNRIEQTVNPSLGPQGINTSIIIADTQFSADFANKTLNGSILSKEFGSDGKIELPESKIEGSTFSGKTDHIHVKGSFYGDKAQELGGVAAGVDDKSNRQFSAAFGAKQKTE